jgi:hypothetical protein
MSLTQYKTIKISDDNYSLEITMDSQNEQKLKCSLRCYKEIHIEGFASPVTVYPVFIIDSTGDNITTIVDITHKVGEIVAEEVVDEEVVNEEVVNEEVVHEEVVHEEVVHEEVVNEEVVNEEVVHEEVVHDEVVNEEVVVDEVVAEEEHDDDFVIEDQFINDKRTWDDEHKEDEVIKDARRVEDILTLFNQQMQTVMEQLELMKKKQETDIREERPLPPIPDKKEIPLRHQHHAPKEEIIEPEERPRKPRPPQNPPPQQQKVETPLNIKITKLQKSYDCTPNIDKNIVTVILEHMKCMEQFNLTGIEKKTIVMNSIETILKNNDIQDPSGFILLISSQLIDTFIAFDKDKINITEKKPSCFPCKLN